ncbi:MAG TPA: CGNR zinc finger domain-containing protein [Gemmatimonadales bacterium]|nr:CGNR zinc finger domain-containing protein [Gemmatimonadales bacterium]
MSHAAFILLGDALWLDFVNTARGRIPHSPDLLPDVEAYAAWCALQRLEPGADTTPFGRVLEIRERLTSLAEALHEGRQLPGKAIAVLNEQLGRSAGSQQLTRVAGDWRLHFAPTRPLAALEAIARSAARTLADVGTAVRRCAGETCSLFFTDSSLTGSRRWCDAATCGVNGRVERRRGNRR